MGASTKKTTTKVAKSKKNSEYVHVPRVASFVVTKDKNNNRVFTPVNKRAKRLVVKAGKRTKATAKDLKQFKGYYKLRQYTDKGLRAIVV